MGFIVVFMKSLDQVKTSFLRQLVNHQNPWERSDPPSEAGSSATIRNEQIYKILMKLLILEIIKWKISAPIEFIAST